MKEVTQELLDFAMQLKFEDLPFPVIHESKRIILDSIAVALAGLSIDKGKIMVNLANRLGGPPEASVLGTGDRLSCANAALANGELMHAMEYDNIMYPLTHVTPFVLASPLAIAEFLKSSGKELILATALAHEIPTRVAMGMDGWRSYIAEGPDAGKFVSSAFERPAVMGYGVNMFGGAVGTGRLLGLDRDQMANALGIAGYIAPVPTSGKWGRTRKVGMAKFAPAGWMSHAEVTAAFLAEMGYTGDQTVLDGEHGFWRFSGSTGWNPDEVTKKLGEEWRFPNGTWYKKYPSGAIIHGALSCFNKIIEDNNLFPEDIDEVSVWSEHPHSSAMERFRAKEIDSEIDAQFNTAYEVAVIAYRIPFDRWQNLDTIRNPRIKQFMQKVNGYVHPQFSKATEDRKLMYRIARVEVKAKGKVFAEEGIWYKGHLFPDENFPKESQQTDEELVSKFRFHAAQILTSRQVEKVPQAILHLEELGNTAELLQLVRRH